MLNRKTLVSVIAIVCCADMAFGAASLRIGGTQNATGTTARAGTLRTGSVKLADVTPKSSVSGGTATPTTIGRLATSTGGSSVGNSHGRISGHGSGASAAALDELERRVNALTDDYGRLDGQYDRLSNDVNYAATTATSANTGINNLRTRVDTVEGKITGLENQGVDTATINGLIDNKIGNFPTKNEVTTQINTASEALRDYADSTGMTETERQELTRLSSAVDTKLSISDAENTYATKTQLDNAIVGNESVLADYVQTTYANAHFATKPEVNTLSERVDSAATSVNSLNAMVSAQSTVVANANNKVTTLENAVVALENKDNSLTASVNALTTALNNKVDATYVTNKINEAQLDGGDVDLSDYYKKPETNALLANKIDTETANATFETRTHAEDTYANRATIENALSQLNTNMANKVTETQLNAAIAAAQIEGSDVDLSDYYKKDEVDALFETQTHATDTYANKIDTLEETVGSHATSIVSLEQNKLDKDDDVINKTNIQALQSGLSAVTTQSNTNKDDITAHSTALSELQSGLSTANGKITALETSDAEQNTNITSVTNKVNNLESNKIPQLETARTQLENAIAQKPSMNDVNDAIAQAELGMDQDEVEAIIGHYLEGASFVTSATYNNKVTEIESTLNTMNGKITENTNGIATLTTEVNKKANQTALETAQANLLAAIAELPNEEQVARIAADAANAAALCAGGRIETQESTAEGGKTVINVNCVTDD